ncbi:MAG: hypothetical protein METHAR1v1_340002 [Methanothrix sp.]|nr:MAG: hypothetical protein METHAR1v1_340002 [Methanothrix sp.]
MEGASSGELKEIRGFEGPTTRLRGTLVTSDPRAFIGSWAERPTPPITGVTCYDERDDRP